MKSKSTRRPEQVSAKPFVPLCLRENIFRAFVILIALAAFSLHQHAVAATASAPSQKPNIILILLDDVGMDDVGFTAAEGMPTATPNLDRFASEAVVLNRFYVTPGCAPTRAMIMTGRAPNRSGVHDVFGPGATMNPSREHLLFQALKDGGYKVGSFGKWHLGFQGAVARNIGVDRILYYPSAGLQGDNPKLNNGSETRQYEGYLTDILTEAAIDFIRENENQPFFVYLPHCLLHVPMQAPKDLFKKYVDAGHSKGQAQVLGMMESFDNNFAKLRGTLAELGIEDNTLIFFTSDNGPSLPLERIHKSKWNGFKGFVYEGGLRVPTAARWPSGGVDGGRKINAVTAAFDLYPTFLDAAGLPTPDTLPKPLDGVSLLPLLRDPDADWPHHDRIVFMQWEAADVPTFDLAWCAIGPRYKLVQPVGVGFDDKLQSHWPPRYTEVAAAQGRQRTDVSGITPRYELYDILADPHELHDIATQHPEVVETMRKKYAEWFKSIEADFYEALPNVRKQIK